MCVVCACLHSCHRKVDSVNGLLTFWFAQPETDSCREVGPSLRDIESSHNNKWQNGFAAKDGTIYGIPLKGSSVIR